MLPQAAAHQHVAFDRFGDASGESAVSAEFENLAPARSGCTFVGSSKTTATASEQLVLGNSTPTHTHTDVEEMFDLSFYFVFVVLGPVGT